MNPDGTVRTAEIQDRARMASDSFYRAAAESARRAVLNPRCSPLRLPPEKYNAWKTLVLNFDRSEEHTSELQSLMRISYAVFCLKKKQYAFSRSGWFSPVDDHVERFKSPEYIPVCFNLSDYVN